MAAENMYMFPFCVRSYCLKPAPVKIVKADVCEYIYTTLIVKLVFVYEAMPCGQRLGYVLHIKCH